MLTPKQRQYLKAEAHHLKPILHIGKGGIGEGLLEELDLVMEAHELVKVKLNQNVGVEREAVVAQLLEGVQGLIHVWTIGHTLLLFRPSRNRPTRFLLPKG